MLKLLNIKIISLLLITNLLTAASIIKTQSCSNFLNSQNAAMDSMIDHIHTPPPPSNATPTNIPYADGIKK